MFRYPRQCYMMLKKLDDDGKKCWASDVRHLLFSCGFSHVWISQGVGNESMFLSLFQQRVKDIFIQSWHNSISSSNFLSHYRSIKSVFSTEMYIDSLRDKALIRVLCKFRISLHTFKINKFRQRKSIDPADMICPNCSSGVIEDEIHVLFNCDKYSRLRSHYLPGIQNMLPCTITMANVLNSYNHESILSLALFLKHVFSVHQT